MSATTAATAAAVIGAALYAGLQQGGILSPGGAPDHLPPADRSNSTSEVQHLHEPAPLQPLVSGDSLHDALLTSADLAQDSNFSWDTEGLLIASTMPTEANRSSSLFVSTANPALSSVCLQLVMVRGGQQLASATLART